ncbi:hypothetical protein [Agarivorans sp. DSG3-1]|uniref:hypothetical protein n=1 Tax=Agarivorans sp. DSG3-1 TaxID=3342249 RepID=UPI00398EC210
MDKWWQEYEHLTSLYKSYLGLMVNLGAFSFAAIGGLSAYILNDAQNKILGLGLLMPLVFSLGLSYLYFRSINPAQELRDALKKLGTKKLKVTCAPHAYLLVSAVRLFSILYGMIAIGLVVLFCKVMVNECV